MWKTAVLSLVCVIIGTLLQVQYEGRHFLRVANTIIIAKTNSSTAALEDKIPNIRHREKDAPEETNKVVAHPKSAEQVQLAIGNTTVNATGFCFPQIKSVVSATGPTKVIEPAEFVYTGGCYAGMRNDRSGSSIIGMIKAHAYCYHFNLTLQGVCAHNGDKKEKRQELIDKVGLNIAIPWGCPHTFPEGILPQRWYYPLGTLLQSREWLEAFRSQIQYPDPDEVFLPLISSGNKNSTIQTVKDRLQVVVYIRRNDVSPCVSYHPKGPPYQTSRYLPNSYYFRLIEEYIPRNKDMDIHVFSLGPYYEPIEDFNQEPYILHKSAAIDVVWRAIMMADVVILSKSGFSEVPALLNNRGKLIYTPYYDPPLEGWTVVKPELIAELDYNVSLMAKEQDCFKHLTKGKNRTMEGPNCTFYSVENDLDYNVSLMAKEQDCFKHLTKGKNRTMEGPNCTLYSVENDSP